MLKELKQNDIVDQIYLRMTCSAQQYSKSLFNGSFTSEWFSNTTWRDIVNRIDASICPDKTVEWQVLPPLRLRCRSSFIVLYEKDFKLYLIADLTSTGIFPVCQKLNIDNTIQNKNILVNLRTLYGLTSDKFVDKHNAREIFRSS